MTPLLSLYKDKRTVWVLLIGILSGYPWALFGSVVTLKLQSEGLSKGSIGLFGLTGLCYALNLMWAPLIDHFRLPLFGRLGGRRKSWILTMHLLVLLCALLLSATPSADLTLVALLCVLMAFAGATQDVAVDALRIELFDLDEPEKLGASAAMATIGWWLGYGGLGAGLILFADQLQTLYQGNVWSQTLRFAVVPGGLVWLTVALLLPEKPAPPPAPLGGTRRNLSQQLAGVLSIYIGPVRSFLLRYGLSLALILLCVVFLFKIGEAFLGRMSLVFYREIGLELGTIGLGKLASTVTVCLSAIAGSLISARWGILSGMLIGGSAMALTNLLFAWLAAIGPNETLFLIAVVADQVTTAVSTVAFVAFLSRLCDRAYTATQYAALASLGNLSRTTLAAGSGYLVLALGDNWTLFFILTALMVLPSLAVLAGLRSRLQPVLGTANQA